MNKSESITKLTLALSKFQGEVKNPPNSADNPFFKSKYAPLDVVINTAKEILARFGISYIQMPGGDGEHVTCVTVLMCEGEWIESDVLVLKADKVTAQGAGAAISYARRYQLTSMLGLAGEEDTDGNAPVPRNDKTPIKLPSTPPKSDNAPTSNIISESQQKRLYAISKGHNDLAKTVLAKYKYNSSKEVQNKDYKAICTEIETLVASNE